MKSIFSLFIIIFALQLLPACRTANHNDSQLSDALAQAGSNKNELQKVIDYYSNQPADSLKLQAALFLIKGMPGKGYEKYALADSNLNNVEVNLFQYRMKDSIRKMKLYLEKLRGKEIVFNDAGFQKDIENINATILIDNIECAFGAWQQPWAKHLSFQQFCEYILPYRLGGEPLQDWRKNFFTHTKWITDSCSNKNVLETTSFINDSVKRGYSYKHLGLFYYPGSLNLKQLNDLTGGRCHDLNMIACYWLRAAGIPVASEFTPYWANSNFGGHSWLSVLDHDGKFVPMTSAYDNPKRDSLPFENKLSKVYRVMYAVQPSSLAYIAKDKETLPPFLGDDHIIDVTDEYIPTKDISVTLEQIDAADHYAYIGTLNGVNWEIVGWSRINDKRNGASFSKLGLGVIYIPLVIRKNEYKVAGKAFLLNQNGEMEILEGNTQKSNLDFNTVDGSRWLKESKQYHLTYWNKDKWEDLEGVETIKGDPQELKKLKMARYVHFANVPENTVLRLVCDSISRPNDYGRPIVIKNGSYAVY